MTFERIVEFTPAYDRRDADPKKNYGIHGVDLRMVLKGEEGAVQFALSTGWYLPETVGSEPGDWGIHSQYSKALHSHAIGLLHPMPTDLGYHSRTPRYEGHLQSDECPYLDGAPCYYDGSTLNAWHPFEALIRGGHEGLWAYLENYYAEVFEAVPA
jgi:hypothetical protein